MADDVFQLYILMSKMENMQIIREQLEEIQKGRREHIS